MKATHRSRWLSKSVSGLSSAGMKRLRRPSNPAPASKPGSESTVSMAVMPASFKWSSFATAAAPPRYSPGRTSSICRAELFPLAFGIPRSQPWLWPWPSPLPGVASAGVL
uniref:Uncharacterized protein n=1 Tax=Sciurus vulgaris TaxID=55149 RepID=A0A8D2B2Q3_SCIVU